MFAEDVSQVTHSVIPAKTGIRFCIITMKKLTLISALLIFGIIALVPVILVTADSLTHNGRLSLESYKDVLAGERQIILFANSLTLASGTAFFSLMIGVPAAFLISWTDLYFKKCLRHMIFIPLIIPPHVSAVAWIYLLGTNGRINLIAEKLFSLPSPLFSVYGTEGAVLVLSLSYFPIVTILAMSGLNSADRESEEAGTLVSSDFYVLRKITLPLIMPNIIAGAVLVGIFSVSNYGVPSLLRVSTYPVEIFVRFGAFYDTKGAVALSLPLIILTFTLLILQHRCMKGRPYISLGSSTKAPRPFSLGRWRILWTGFVMSVILLSAVLPVSALIAESGSLTTYRVAFETAYPQIFTSFALSVTAATLATLLSFFLAYISEKTGWRGRCLTDFLFFVPFAIPGAILGIGLISVWNRPATDFVYESAVIVIFAYIARFSPFAVKAVATNLGQIHPRLEEAAVLSAASWPRQVSVILAPLTKPGLLAGWIITFIFSMGELGATLLVVPPGKTTLSVRIYTVMHYGAGNLTACLCLILIIITIIPVFLLTYPKVMRR